ncbi:MAG: Fe(3+) ABC transporter substrate-binding protein [Planctomycetota bacterium]
MALNRLVRGFVALVCSAVASGIAAQGVVNVYSARHYPSDDALYERFTEQTGIEVRLLEAKSDELLTRIRNEGDASPADVFIAVDAARLQRAEDQGVFQSVSSSEIDADVPESLRHPDGLWFGLTTRARVIFASRDRVGDDVTLDYEDLATPAWDGRVLIRSSTNVYNQSLVASMIETVGAEQAEAWCRGIVANMSRRPQGGDTDQIRALAAGEGDVAVANHYYYMRMLVGSEADQAAAAKVRVIFPNQDNRGTHVNICGAGVVANAPNRENAVRFIEFLLSDEAQRAFAAGNREYPVANDVEPSQALQDLGEFKADAVNVSALGRNNTEAVKMMDRAGWR